MLLGVAGVDPACAVGRQTKRPPARRGDLGRRAVVGYAVHLPGLAAHVQDIIERDADPLGVIDAVGDELELIDPDERRRGEVEHARLAWLFGHALDGSSATPLDLHPRLPTGQSIVNMNTIDFPTTFR